MDTACGHLRTSLPKLANMTVFLLNILHSNAAKEHIFIIIAKNKAKFRSRLDNKFLNPIMLIKMSKPESFKPRYQWNFSDVLLKNVRMHVRSIISNIYKRF